MKYTILLLLLVAVLAGIGNLLILLGIVPAGAHQYRAYTATQMDEIGFRKLAEANGLEVSEEGKITFPEEMRDKLLKPNMLPFTIEQIEKDGWTFVSVTVDNHYLFRK